MLKTQWGHSVGSNNKIQATANERNSIAKKLNDVETIYSSDISQWEWRYKAFSNWVVEGIDFTAMQRDNVNAVRCDIKLLYADTDFKYQPRLWYSKSKKSGKIVSVTIPTGTNEIMPPPLAKLDNAQIMPGEGGTDDIRFNSYRVYYDNGVPVIGSARKTNAWHVGKYVTVGESSRGIPFTDFPINTPKSSTLPKRVYAPSGLKASQVYTNTEEHNDLFFKVLWDDVINLAVNAVINRKLTFRSDFAVQRQQSQEPQEPKSLRPRRSSIKL